MANVSVLDVLKFKQQTFQEFNFDMLQGPQVWMLLSQQDVDKLHYIATSLKLASKIEKRYQMIDEIMTKRGFKKLASGTNRVVYKYLEDQSIVAKIALDKVGLQDNPNEFVNQELIKPFCAKMFSISPCGTVGIAERVLPITNNSEFMEIGDDVFDLIVYKLIGKYVMDDIGCDAYMNYGIRIGFGPVLLDYPYVYELDGNALYCNKIDIATGLPCDGLIDYDGGFNHLVCTKCGCMYSARDLGIKRFSNSQLIEGGSSTMKIAIKRGDEIQHINGAQSDYITRKPRPNTADEKSVVKHFKAVVIDDRAKKVDDAAEEHKSVLLDPEKVQQTVNSPATDNDKEKATEVVNKELSKPKAKDGNVPPFYMDKQSPKRKPNRATNGRFVKKNPDITEF